MKTGFTLIEVIISACVISAFFSSFFIFVTSDPVIRKRGENTLCDLVSIESAIESLRSIPFETIKDSAGISVKKVDPDTKSIEISKGGYSVECAISRF
ncbi:MAG: hypothetical protein WC490_02670 [Candidatus Margulisiibacteriota bacterium]